MLTLEIIHFQIQNTMSSIFMEMERRCKLFYYEYRDEAAYFVRNLMKSL